MNIATSGHQSIRGRLDCCSRQVVVQVSGCIYVQCSNAHTSQGKAEGLHGYAAKEWRQACRRCCPTTPIQWLVHQRQPSGSGHPDNGVSKHASHARKEDARTTQHRLRWYTTPRRSLKKTTCLCFQCRHTSQSSLRQSRSAATLHTYIQISAATSPRATGTASQTGVAADCKNSGGSAADQPELRHRYHSQPSFRLQLVGAQSSCTVVQRVCHSDWMGVWRDPLTMVSLARFASHRPQRDHHR
jgi:hypothetical protein